MSDRPLECSGCKNPISIIYKEIEKGSISCTHMCESCPNLKKKLKGEVSSNLEQHPAKTLCCSTCKTSYESFLLDGFLGCSECYHIFEVSILEKLKTESLIPKKLQDILETNAEMPLHLGKTPHGEFSKVLSSQVSDLNEALNEALVRENYEQAAQLRDQIKQLMENTDDRS